MSKQLQTLLVCCLTVMICLAGHAISPNAWAGEINTDSNNVAIKGYDPVAYFTMSEAVRGSEDHIYEWLGAKWYFASKEHRIAFEADPTKYLPQYGGYCAVGVSMGRRVTDIDPERWEIVDGKLYLNYDDDMPGDAKELIHRADARWDKHKQYFTAN